jgi:hypothetical protein
MKISCTGRLFDLRGLKVPEILEWKLGIIQEWRDIAPISALEYTGRQQGQQTRDRERPITFTPHNVESVTVPTPTSGCLTLSRRETYAK